MTDCGCPRGICEGRDRAACRIAPGWSDDGRVPIWTVKEIPDEPDLLAALETLSDTPTRGLYRNGELIAVGVIYAPNDAILPKVALALNAART